MRQGGVAEVLSKLELLPLSQLLVCIGPLRALECPCYIMARVVSGFKGVQKNALNYLKTLQFTFTL